VAGITPSQTVGPFFGFALPFADGPELVAKDAAGALWLDGQLIDGAGEPVSDGLVEMWQGDLFGRCKTDREGVFHFTVVKPAAMPAPGGGTQAPHLNVTVFARGLLKHLVTRMYFPDEEAANAQDPVLNAIPEAGRRATLVAQAEGGKLRFDIRLQGEGETVFFDVDGPRR
jgi:protocatechuate 3,4-dioxygenase alpha subunit